MDGDLSDIPEDLEALRAALIAERGRRIAAEADAIAARAEAVSAIDESQHPWALMSLQSLTLAVAARLMAYGRMKESYFNSGLLGEWAQLALLCPTMVANDLLIAEAVVLYDRRGNVIGKD